MNKPYALYCCLTVLILSLTGVHQGLVSAQPTRMPARQIEVSTGDWTYVEAADASAQGASTAQGALDWLDELWPTTQIRTDQGPWVSTTLLFEPLAFDLENLHSYLLGGPYYEYSIETNVVGGVTNYVFSRDEFPIFTYGSSYDSPSPRALVPELQRSQNITQSNFSNVNHNILLTTNLFTIVGNLLDVWDNTDPVNLDLGLNMTIAEAYLAWVAAYLDMDTDYEDLPVDLVFAFPSLFEKFKQGLELAQGDLESLRTWVDANYVSYTYFYNYMDEFKAEFEAMLVEKYGLSDTGTVTTTSTEVHAFVYVGAELQTVSVPAGATNVAVYAWGAAGGGGGWAAPAGFSRGNLEVVTNTPPGAGEVNVGSNLYVQVGERGGFATSASSYGGGGASTRFGGGGGRSALLRTLSLTNELLVAAGGGGGAGDIYEGVAYAYDTSVVRSQAGRGGGPGESAWGDPVEAPQIIQGQFQLLVDRRNSGGSTGAAGGGGGGYYGGGAGGHTLFSWAAAPDGWYGAGAGGSGYVGGMSTNSINGFVAGTAQSSDTNHGKRWPPWTSGAHGYAGSAGVSGGPQGYHGLVVITFSIPD